MAQVQVTAVEGLKADEVDSVWADFDMEKKIQKQKVEDAEKAEINVENEYADNFENDDKSDKHDDDSTRDNSVSTPRHASNETLDGVDSPHKERKSRKRHKQKPRKSHHNTTASKPPPLNLHPDHPRKHTPHRRTRPGQADAMSDQENIRRGRKLHRRGQMKKFRSMEVDVEQAGRDRLEQKFQELEELMTRPLADTRGIHIPQQRLHKMVAMQQQHASLGHRSANHRDHRHENGTVGPWFGDAAQEEEEQEDNHAYSTIRVLQTAGPSSHAQNKYPKHVSPRPGSAQRRDDHSPRNHTTETHLTNGLSAKPPPPQGRKGSVESSPTSSSGASQHRQDENDKYDKYERYCNEENHSDEAEKDYNYDDSDVTPRRIYLPADMHLKYSNNPKLKEWLKRKNAEYRRQKKAERAKRREERNDKMVEQELKNARREKSSERVKEWMDTKRKEAILRNKQEHRLKKQCAQEEAAYRSTRSPSGGVSGKRIDRPASAPANSNKNYIPIKRPESAVKLDNGDGTVPKPPDSKFVYKRPVSGRVKLMKLQNERKARAKSADQQRYEALSPEEKEKRARMSYDAWLVSKRKEDQEKKREAVRQKELIKSDPELERIIPDMAKRRIERIKSGKKRIDTGMKQIDDQSNKSFGGGDFDEDDQSTQRAITDGTRTDRDQPPDNVPQPSSYNLAVDGAAASLVEVNTRARPVSAKTRMSIPQSAFSPRRPKSATPKVKAVMEKDHSAEPNPYKLPFPDSLGVPDHVRQTQERIFSKDLIESTNSERPEPQGCASVEMGGCPKGIDGVRQEPAPRSSLVLLQEIEAAAVKSEKQAHTASSNDCSITAPASLEDKSKEETQPANQPQDGEAPKQDRTTKVIANMKPRGGVSMQRNFETDDDDDDEVQYEEEEREEVTEVERTWGDQKLIPAPAFKENLQDLQLEPDLNSVESPFENSPENLTRGRYAGEAETSASGDQNKEESQDPLDIDPPSLSIDSDSGKDTSEEDSTLRKSVAKHVSFSEEAPTVFKVQESVDTETSSNFEDERGSDDKEEESAYVSLDDAPL